MHNERSACPLDCPDACSLQVTVAAGKVLALDGDRRNPDTAGFICGKVRGFAQRVYGAERVGTPLIRSGPKGSGSFQAVSWEQALSLVAQRLSEARARSGGHSILPLSYGGSNGALSQNAVDARLFRRLGALNLARTVCAAVTNRVASALYGNMPGVAFQDYPEARLIVIWGANPSASNIHLVPWVKRARERGARLVVIDPRRIPLARKADLHLALRPGTDAMLALAVHRHLFASGQADEDFLERHTTGWRELRQRAQVWPFERAADLAGISVRDLQEFADLYASLAPSVVRCGWGVERNRNGASAVAAILALPAVAGRFGVRGGGYTLSNQGAWKLPSEPVIGASVPAAPVVNMNRLGRTLLGEEGPQVDVLFVYNHNPLASLPDQGRVRRGLEREDLFCVVFDQVLTDSARYADVVLPATTFLEHADLSSGYGSYALHDILPVIEPVGQARSNVSVFAELLRRLNLHQPGDAESCESLRAILLKDLDRETRASLKKDGVASPACGRQPVQFEDVHPRTPSGRAELFPPDLDAEAKGRLYDPKPPPSDVEHLTLISPGTARTTNSTLGELARSGAALSMNPEDARQRGLCEGDLVRVHNELGEVRCSLEPTAEMRPGVVMLPKGQWCSRTPGGRTANTLCPDDLNAVAGGACFNDARVLVELCDLP